MILLSISDFVGFNWVSFTTQQQPFLQAFIDRYEKQYLCKILGVELAELFIADLPNASQDPRFAAIQDEFYVQTDAGTIYQSRGLVDTLACMVFYHYVTDKQSHHTISGVAARLTEASETKTAETAARYAEKRFNEALISVDAIQYYCKEHLPADYPEYKGIHIGAIYSAFL